MMSLFREKSVSRRLHCRLDPGMRGKRKTVVHIYLRATAGVHRVLQGMQERPDPGRDCRESNPLWVVGSREHAGPAEFTQVEEGSHPESCTGPAGSAFDVAASDGGSGEEY